MKIKNLFLGIFFLVVGILMICIPETCIKVIVILTGVAALVNGIYSIKSFYNLSENLTYKKMVKIKCISSIVVGILAVFFPLALMKSFSAIWNIITFVLAVYFVLYALAGFFSSSVDETLSSDSKKRIAYESSICLLIAVLLFITPIGSIVKTLFIICGIAGVLFGMFVILKEVIIIKKSNKKVTESVNNENEKIEDTKNK